MPEDPTHLSLPKAFEHGIAMAPVDIDQRFEARAYLVVSAKNPRLLVAACGVHFDDGYPGGSAAAGRREGAAPEG